VIASPSTSEATRVSVAVSVVPSDASVTAPVLSEFAITGSSSDAAAVTVEANETVTELSHH
jgi:hypothetical protein